MINGLSVLGVIPARGGSKGLPDKNIRPFSGIPLIAHTIRQAKNSSYIDRCILSSEDETIIQIAKEFSLEVPFIRPKYLAEDSTSGLDVVIHAAKNILGYDIVVLLQPTSPLRKSKDIDNCIFKMVNRNAKVCVSVTPPTKSPYWMYKLAKDDGLISLFKDKPLITIRQKLPKVYAVNGAVYVAKIDWFLENKTFINNETIAHIMPGDRSVDIDNEIDFLFAEFLFNLKNKH